MMNAFITTQQLQIFRFQQDLKPWGQRTCQRQPSETVIGKVWMKTKSGNDKRSKRKAASPAAGFGKATEKKQPMAKTANKKEPSDQQIDERSGTSGGSTPHQMRVDNPVEALVDPSEELREEEPEPLMALPVLSEDELRQFRFDLGTPIDDLIKQFTEAQQRDDFDSVLVANRHLISEALLVRYTNMILKVESEIPTKFSTASTKKRRRSSFGFNINAINEQMDEDDSNDVDDEEIKGPVDDDSTEAKQLRQQANGMRQLRKTLVAYAWSYDYAFKRAILQAEARLLKVLKGDNVTRDVELNCGRSTLEVNAFWTVIYAAVVAWEERGMENEQLVNVDTQKALTDASAVCRSSKAVLSRLSESLKSVQQILVTTTANVQIEVVDKMDDDTVVELIAYMEAVRMLPMQAYGGLVNRLGFIVEYIRQAKYGLDPLTMKPIEFQPVDVRRGSKLIQFLDKYGETKSL